MRPVTKNICRTKPNGTIWDYKPYGSAKEELTQNLGEYCSYCECGTSFVNIEVEHIQSKNKMPHLTYKWDNFLLACKTCNIAKSNQDVDLLTFRFPHKHNTFALLQILESGVIRINPDLDSGEQNAIGKTINLVKLTNNPHNGYSRADRRWMNRSKVWMLAKKYLHEYETGKISETTLLTITVDLAEGYGFWSVFMTVFADFPSVMQCLIDKFPGTNKSYFHPSPMSINRNGVDI